MSAAGDVPGLAENLSWLRRNVPSRSGDFYTFPLLAADLRDRGIEISIGHLAALHRGEKTSIGAQLLWEIAALYTVPINYFWDAETREAVRVSVARFGDLRAAALDRLADNGS